jgi:hypothetical protein
MTFNELYATGKVNTFNNVPSMVIENEKVIDSEWLFLLIAFDMNIYVIITNINLAFKICLFR